MSLRGIAVHVAMNDEIYGQSNGGPKPLPQVWNTGTPQDPKTAIAAYNCIAVSHQDCFFPSTCTANVNCLEKTCLAESVTRSRYWLSGRILLLCSGVSITDDIISCVCTDVAM